VRWLPEAELATDPGDSGWPNEDFAAVAPGAAVLLDGCTTTPRGADTGCAHGVAWYARTLGTDLLAAITEEPRVPLAGALAAAIEQVRDRHKGTCDLTVRTTPAATVTAVRAVPDGIEYLALSDSSIAADFGEDQVLVITDNHRAAKADPDAARQATTGTIPLDGLHGVALLSDGTTRITDTYHLTDWPGLMQVLRDQGPAALIAQVREAEDDDPAGVRWPRCKPRDDATALYWQLPART
jgi:Protein phosphatase 2C